MAQQDSVMRGKVCLITGGNSGIGKATALGLARLGATLVVVCRDPGKGKAAVTEIKTKSRNSSVDLMVADLSSQASIRQLVQDFKDRYPQLHVLVNNAGIWLKTRSVTVDGLETTFAVNHLAYFLLTNLLLDVLKTNAPARIVNVASSLEEQGAINFDDLQAERHYDPDRAYSQSKLANVLFTYELARRLKGTGVTVNCLHPGVVRTNLVREMPKHMQIISQTFASPENGAETSIYLASSPEVEGISGKYFVNKTEVQSSRASYNASVGQRLWQVSAELTKLKP